MDPHQQQKLTGVVIISLPPADNPSLGKTITAFTIGDPVNPNPSHDAPSSPSSHISFPSSAANTTSAGPMHPSHLTPVSSSSAAYIASSSSLRIARRVVVVGAAALLLLFIHQCFSYARSELRLRNFEGNDERRDDGVQSFMFDLHPKSDGGLPTDVEAKLGSFVGRRGTAKRHWKNGDAVDSSVAVFPVGGNVYPDGLYYVSILVGNPARPYYLDLDTGSDLTWIQCDAPCTSCAKGPHPFYKPTREKLVPGEDSLCREVYSNQNLAYCESCSQCDYEIEYADQSSSMGVLARDELTLKIANGKSLKQKFVFGCAYDQQGQLSVSPANTDGILGLSSAKVSLPSQLASQGIINNVMGHCIPSGANNRGYLFLGDAFVPRWGMNWIPMLGGSTNFYHAEITKVSHGGKRLVVGGKGSNAGQVVFDTGSSYTYFTKELYTSLITSLKDVPLERLNEDGSDSTLPICWQVNLPLTRSVEDVKQFFKPLTLHFGSKWWFGSKTLVIHPEGYLIISNKGNVCLGILDGSEVYDGSMNILGDISLHGQLVVYDNVNQQIGWVRSDCLKPQNFMSWSFF